MIIPQKISHKDLFTFKTIVHEALNFHAPLKTKYLGEPTQVSNVKPSFATKVKVSKIITLVEGNEIITNHGKIAQTFNEYFWEYCLNIRSLSFPLD